MHSHTDSSELAAADADADRIGEIVSAAITKSARVATGFAIGAVFA